ncbi:MAG: S8 family serine peptidase [Burkholderiaceae bacterium]
MKLKLTSTAVASLALLASLSAHAQTGVKTYIVQLKDEPAASYQGTTSGYAATQAPAGTPFSSRSSAALLYSSYLRSKQAAVLSTVTGNSPISQLDTVFNGFTARLTPAQAATLSLNANVAAVAEDQLLTPATISTPTFLGLTAPGGVWSQTDGNNVAIKGENMILGDVDLGIWPESPSYADHVDGDGKPTFTGGTLAYGPPPAGWTGSCVAGDAFVPAQACNNKLIGAKYYNANLLSSGVTLDWTAFNSPRDDLGGATGLGGHGDHTASTAAGNDKVPAVVAGVTMGLASGMAPRARIAAYKVCFTFISGATNKNSCSSADSMAAIDQAVKDGVNAINFSISGSTGTTNDMVEQAFYRAALANVFVAAAAGNSGPTNTVNHPSPWLTTVAAATHDRILEGDVTLGNGAKYTGASLNVAPLASTPMIDAQFAGVGGGNARLCFTPGDISASPAAGQVTLDPALVAGKVVICSRGTSARVNKSLAVLQAGGVGMVLADNGAGLVSEVHSVPTVHVSAADGTAIKAYAFAGGSPTAAESAFYFGHQAAPTIAAFSGRGPNMADVNVLKPDIAAPGVGVIASVTPGYTQDQRNQLAAGTLAAGPAWASYDGTSMATPHITGISLLLKQAHPTWSPSAIKSAMMTTAFDTLNDGLTGMQNGKLPWSQGAGFISPNKAINPGLVYDMGKADYVRYQCLTQKSLVSASDCSTYGTLDQTYNLNLASITAGAMVGTTAIHRTVTNVGTSSATYTASAVMNTADIAATVSPATLTLAPGASAPFTITMTPSATAPKFTWEYGTLTWSDGTHNVRSPIQVALGQSIQAPADMFGSTVSGSRMFTIGTGFSGKSTALKGMKDVTLGAPVVLTPNASLNIATACAAGTSTTSIQVYPMVVPAGTIAARFALRQADVSGADDDNDLAVITPGGVSYVSGSGTSHETIELLSPAAGTYKVCVAAYASANPTSTHSLSSWIVSPGNTAGGAFNVLMPGSVYAGGTATVGFSWSGLTVGHRYFGGAQFLDLSGTPGAATALNIDTTPGTPLDVITTTANDKANVTSK